MEKSAGAPALGAHVIYLAQWKADQSKESAEDGSDEFETDDDVLSVDPAHDAFTPSNLPPLDREDELQKWMNAFDQYVAAYELCRMGREQATATVALAIGRGRSAEEQAGWFEREACRLVLASKFLDSACARVEFVSSTVQALA